jgi:hypothetical protein
LLPSFACTDVDNLTAGKGFEQVDVSQVFLVFSTAGFWQRPNCMRELLRAYLTGKPLIALIELEVLLGGLEPQHIRERLTKTQGMLETWGLAHEVSDEWSLGPLPTAQQLAVALLDGLSPPLECTREEAIARRVAAVLARSNFPAFDLHADREPPVGISGHGPAPHC